MTTEAVHQRRASDGRIPWGKIGNMILLWGSVLTMLSVGVAKWSAFVGATEKVPKLERRVDRVDRRLQIMEWYLPAIGAKLGVPPPPRLRDRHDRDREDNDD